MFDPPDYLYKDLTDTYAPDDLLFNNNSCDTKRASNNNEPLDHEPLLVTNTESQILFQTNDAGRYFNPESSIFSENSVIDHNISSFLSQPDILFNSETSLLDENTVNQFLLPLQNSDEKKDNDSVDILALHTCVICNEIFTKEVDLLDHAISAHSSNVLHQNNCDLQPSSDVINSGTGENNDNAVTLGSDWLICGICERVLSTVLEVEPNEQLCCLDEYGKSNILSRNLVTMYVCDYCSGLFASGEALDKHKLTCFIENSENYFTEERAINNEVNTSQQPEVYYSCDICGEQYFSMLDLRIHSSDCQGSRTRQRTYTNSTRNKMWNCGSCNQLFVTARELYRHKRGEDRPQGTPLTAYICEDCDKVLGSMCALHTHKKMHKVSKPGFPCKVCGRRFNQSGHLAIHMRMHTGERPYPCDLCPKAFKVKVDRDDHRRTHTGERPFACTACPKTFTAAARLREHARTHTDQRPYRCDICGAAFRRPYARTVHTLIHTGEKPHECDICGSAFRRSGDMWKHKRTVHGITPDADFKKTVKSKKPTKIGMKLSDNSDNVLEILP